MTPARIVPLESFSWHGEWVASKVVVVGGTSGLYVDRALLRDELGVGDGDIDEALRETVAASARRPSR